MLGPEVRRCYEEGVGFITAVGVHRDATGLALARPRGGQGGGRAPPGRHRAHPGRRRSSTWPSSRPCPRAEPRGQHLRGGDARARRSDGGDRHRADPVRARWSGPTGLLRKEGYAAPDGVPLADESVRAAPAREYGHLDVVSTMRRLVDDIASGKFADEWDAERQWLRHAHVAEGGARRGARPSVRGRAAYAAGV